MSDVRRYQEVMMSSKEYIVYSTVDTEDSAKIEMVFDEEVTLQDIQVQYFTNSATGYPPSGNVVLQYPTGEELVIASSVSDWNMNQNDDSRNLWYSVPPETSLFWEPSNPAAGQKACIVLSAIGRG